MESLLRLFSVGDKEGKVRVVRTIGGRRKISESEIKRILGLRKERVVVGYARVSSTTQKMTWRGRSSLGDSNNKRRWFGSQREQEGLSQALRDGY